MKRLLISIISGGLVLFAGAVQADEHEGGDPANPVEIFACNFNDGMGPADLDAPIRKFNAFADKRGWTEYSAWTLMKYYAGESQDFDFLWVGASPSAQALGRMQDQWLAEGAKIQDAFDEVSPCTGHGNYASLTIKQAPDRVADNLVVSFSDCNMAEGLRFGDVGPSLMEWGKYREGHGSTAGMWVWFPAYGQGGEEFDFKFIAAWENLEDQGADWDQYSAEGWQKAEELFAGKLDCDASRVYLATNRRRAADNEE